MGDFMDKFVKTQDLAVFYDGIDRFYFGTMQRENLFVSISGHNGAWLEEDQINNDFFLGKKNVMILKDAIEGNVYGEDRNYGGENGNLTEYENCFLKRLYRLGDVCAFDLVKYEAIFSAYVFNRMQQNVAENKMESVMKELQDRLAKEQMKKTMTEMKEMLTSKNTERE